MTQAFTNRDKRELLLLSKTQLIKKCNNLNVSSRGNKSELVNTILLKKKQQQKKKEGSNKKKKKRKTAKQIELSNSEVEMLEIDYQLLIFSFVQQIERDMINMIIPIEVTRLCIAYYTHLGQFYFDPNGYTASIWKHNTHKRMIYAAPTYKRGKGKRHCVYILYNNNPINVHKIDNQAVFFCTVRYDSNKKGRKNTSDCWFGVMSHKLKSMTTNKKEYKKGVVCGWKDNESITIELDLKRYKVWYYKSYGHEIHYKRYTMMTKKIERADKYYFMLCGSVKKGDRYTLRNIGDIKAYNVTPLLFLKT